MAKITPSQGEILALFRPGELIALSEIAEHFQTSARLLQLEIAKMPRIHRFGQRYRIIEVPETPNWYKAKPLDLQKHYGAVMGRVADARAIPSRGGD